MLALRRVHPAWWLLIFSSLALVLLGGARQAFAVLYKPITEDMEWSRAGLAWAATIGQFVFAGGSLIAGMAIDRFPARVIVAIFALLHLAGYLVLAGSGHLWQAYVGYGVLESLAYAVAVGPFLSITSHWFHKRQGLALAVISSSIALGAVAMAPLTALLIGEIGWRYTLVVLAVLPTLAMLAMAPMVHAHPQEVGRLPFGAETAPPIAGERGRQSGPDTSPTLKSLARDRRMWMICGAYAGVNISIGMVLYHGVAYASDRGLDPLTSAAVLSVVFLASIAGRMGGGLLVGRLGIHKLVVGSFAGVAASTLLLLMSSQASSFYAASALYGVFMGLTIVLIPLVCGGTFRGNLGTAVGLLILVLNVGGGAGAVMGGFAFEYTGSYAVAFLSASLMAVAATGLALRLRFPAESRTAVRQSALGRGT